MLSIGGYLPPEKTGTILNAVTATGAGAALALGSLLSKHSVTLTWGGTVPISAVVALEGSQDGTNYVAMKTIIMDASPYIQAVVNVPVKYVRGNYVSKVGGDGTTAITMTYSGGGN